MFVICQFEVDDDVEKSENSEKFTQHCSKRRWLIIGITATVIIVSIKLNKKLSMVNKLQNALHSRTLKQ